MASRTGTAASSLHEHAAGPARDHAAHAHGPARDLEGHAEAGDPGLGARMASSASVALDIGEGRGALVIYLGERFRNLELEISRADELERRVHTGVHDRGAGNRSILTAVFGSLDAGDYVVWMDAVTEGPLVTVKDGAVTELHLKG